MFPIEKATAASGLAGLSGGSGLTLVVLKVLEMFAPKGPDYIAQCQEVIVKLVAKCG